MNKTPDNYAQNKFNQKDDEEIFNKKIDQRIVKNSKLEDKKETEIIIYEDRGIYWEIEYPHMNIGNVCDVSFEMANLKAHALKKANEEFQKKDGNMDKVANLLGWDIN